MKAEIKELWIAALEGGEYKQGKGVLNRAEAYCCLGVLCDIHRKETNLGAWRPHEGNGEVKDYFGSNAALPDEVIEWAALPPGEYDPMVSDGLKSSCLSSWNDCYDKTFPEIAQLIKASNL